MPSVGQVRRDHNKSQETRAELFDFEAVRQALPGYEVIFSAGCNLAIRDERSTLHRSAADHWPHRRVIRRLEIDGDRPYFDPAP